MSSKRKVDAVGKKTEYNAEKEVLAEWDAMKRKRKQNQKKGMKNPTWKR